MIVIRKAGTSSFVHTAASFLAAAKWCIENSHMLSIQTLEIVDIDKRTGRTVEVMCEFNLSDDLLSIN